MNGVRAMADAGTAGRDPSGRVSTAGRVAGPGRAGRRGRGGAGAVTADRAGALRGLVSVLVTVEPPLCAYLRLRAAGTRRASLVARHSFLAPHSSVQSAARPFGAGPNSCRLPDPLGGPQSGRGSPRVFRQFRGSWALRAAGEQPERW